MRPCRSEKRDGWRWGEIGRLGVGEGERKCEVNFEQYKWALATNYIPGTTQI